jgi:alpha-beta hydrolase superfamily lysophospholipase
MVRRRVASLSAAARAACLVVLSLLGACAPELAKQGSENVSPTIESDAFVTRDGLRLPVRHWDAGHPRAVIVALHGMSDYSNAFDMPGTWLATQGITTLAYDQRGFGKSPDPGIWAGADALRTDLADFIDAAHARYPGVPVYALGESMGGAVVLSSLASARPPRADGIILVAPAVWSRSDMPLSYRIVLWLTAHTMPSLTVSGRGLKIWPSDNIEMLRKLSRDPLFQHETRADAVWGLVNLMDEARHAPERLPARTLPILVLTGANDQIIPKEPAEAVIAALGDRAHAIRYPHGYHMLLRDLDAKTVWTDLRDWVSRSQSTPD